MRLGPVVTPTARIRARLSRGWSLSSLGANEARLLFDAGAGAGGLAAALLFLELFVPGSTSLRQVLPLLAAPILFLAWNVLAGLYTRLRIAAWPRKAVVLLGAVAATSVSCLLLGAPVAGVVLWGLIVAAPVVLGRAFVALPFTRHASLVTTLVANRHGPVVVLGGAGYIGSHTVDLLLRHGYEVRVLDRLMYGRDPIAEFIDHPRFELIEGDVTEITKLTRAARNASAVIHLAGLVGDPACAVDVDFTRHTNIVATRMAKEVAQSLGVYRFLFASSCSVYGVSDTEVDERSALNPMSLYAHTKIDSERELLYAVRDDFFVTVLRFATVFGHSRRPRFDLVANLFTAQAMTEGRITVRARPRGARRRRSEPGLQRRRPPPEHDDRSARRGGRRRGTRVSRPGDDHGAGAGGGRTAQLPGLVREDSPPPRLRGRAGARRRHSRDGTSVRGRLVPALPRRGLQQRRRHPPGGRALLRSAPITAAVRSANGRLACGTTS
ncbi:MAG: NAD-dependent epimerase/dehydratase family protein [Deltaproteobacteria bacterium]|nr:MAG: NAD-dependent epimerase/dehydratase family protein [Deltaproteobacteria bacterium]